MLQVSVALTTASVKGVRSAAATHSQYMYIPKKTKKMRLKGMRKQIMKMVKAIEWDCVVLVVNMCLCVCTTYSYFTASVCVHAVLVYSYCVCPVSMLCNIVLSFAVYRSCI